MLKTFLHPMGARPTITHYSDIQYIKQFSAFQLPDIGSSVKLGGVHIRGKNAAAIQMVYAVFALAAFAVQAAVVIIVFLAQMLWILLQVLFAFLCWLLPILWDGCGRLGQSVSAAVQAGKRSKRMPLVEALAADPAHALNKWTLPELKAALIDIVTAGGRGKPLAPPFDEILESIAAKTAADRVRTLLLAIATVHKGKADESALVPLYLRIDDQCVQDGGRTRLQELLLEDYAALNRLKLKSE